MKIHLKGLTFYAYHGVYSEENQKGNSFVIDLTLSIKKTQIEIDELTETVDYSAVRSQIAEEMQTPTKLLETLAQKIQLRLFKKFEEVQKVKLKIKKLSPAIGGVSKYTAISLTQKRKNIAL